MHRAILQCFQKGALNSPVGPKHRLSKALVSSQSLSAISSNNRQAEWHKALFNAEKIVGTPSATFVCKLLMNESKVGAAGHINKLLRTSHPVKKTTKRLIYHGRYQLQTRGIVVLLFSKCAGHIEGNPQMSSEEWEEVSKKGITNRQKMMSEIVEMVYTSHMIHRDVLNVSRELITDQTLLEELQYGNKIAILIGDILIANASKMTAELNNCKVLELIATSISDFMKSEFIISHDSFGRPFPPQHADITLWEDRNYLNTGSLLAHAFRSTLIMGGHGEANQRRAEQFGRSLGHLWQLHDELEPFVNLLFQAPGTQFDLTSFPVFLYLQKNPHVLASIEATVDSRGTNGVDYADLYAKILSSGVIDEARQRLQKYVNECLEHLEGFDQCYEAKEAKDAKEALTDIVLALK